jgi:hypothetical protein
LAIRGVTADRREVPCFEKMELRVDLSATYRNPFDPEEIDLSAEFTAPSGKKVTVPGFLYQPFQRRLDGRNERLEAAGAPEWRIRFSPTETGEYRYVVIARDRSGTVRSQPATFRALAGTRPGFVRVSKDDPYYFAFDNGSPYFPLGANVCFPVTALPGATTPGCGSVPSTLSPWNAGRSPAAKIPAWGAWTRRGRGGSTMCWAWQNATVST